MTGKHAHTKPIPTSTRDQIPAGWFVSDICELLDPIR